MQSNKLPPCYTNLYQDPLLSLFASNNSNHQHPRPQLRGCQPLHNRDCRPIQTPIPPILRGCRPHHYHTAHQPRTHLPPYKVLEASARSTRPLHVQNGYNNRGTHPQDLMASDLFVPGFNRGALVAADLFLAQPPLHNYLPPTLLPLIMKTTFVLSKPTTFIIPSPEKRKLMSPCVHKMFQDGKPVLPMKLDALRKVLVTECLLVTTTCFLSTSIRYQKARKSHTPTPYVIIGP